MRPACEAVEAPTRVPGYKAKSDPRAIESRIGMLGSLPLSYEATTFEVSGCNAITLTLYLANTLLMRIDLSLIRPPTGSSGDAGSSG